MKYALIIAAGLTLACGVAGCGEKPTATVYKQGQYQGKPDSQPWANNTFKNDQASWENAIKARSDGQNEYARIGSQ
jgi:hypothetical protein